MSVTIIKEKLTKELKEFYFEFLNKHDIDRQFVYSKLSKDDMIYMNRMFNHIKGLYCELNNIKQTEILPQKNVNEFGKMFVFVIKSNARKYLFNCFDMNDTVDIIIDKSLNCIFENTSEKQLKVIYHRFNNRHIAFQKREQRKQKKQTNTEDINLQEYFDQVHTAIFDEKLNNFKHKSHSNFGCIAFKQQMDNMEKFTEALEKGIEEIQATKISKNVPVHLEECPFRNLNKVSEEVAKQIEEQYKEFAVDKNNRPVVSREAYQLQSINDVRPILNECFENEIYPLKVKYQLLLIIEGEEHTVKNGKNEHSENTETYYRPSHVNAKKTTVSKTRDLILNSFNDTNYLFDSITTTLEDYINNTQNNLINSRELYVACYGIQFIKYAIGLSGKSYKELNIYEPFKTIKVCNEDDNLCVFKALAFGLDETTRANKIKSLSLGLYKTFYGKAYNKTYKGFNWIDEIERLCKTFEVNITKYQYNVATKELTTLSIHDYKFPKTINVISHTFENGSEHVMFVQNIDSLTSLVHCQKCGKTFKNNQNGRYLLNKHEEECEGDIKQTLKTTTSVPYCPVFYNNLLFTFCRINNLKYTPLKYYCTYDFETFDSLMYGVKNKDQETIVNAYLNEFSVALSWNSPSREIETRYYCLFNVLNNQLIKNEHFVEDFINDCIKIAPQIKEYNKQNFLNNLTEEQRNQFENDKHFNKYLNEYCNTVSILGWNSERFDSNFIRTHLHGIETSNISILGSSTSTKQLVINDPENNVKIAFKDAMNYVAPCSLDNATKDYGKCDNRVKGIFPYSKLNEESIETELLRVEPFEQNDFYNTLKQEPLSDSDYQMYLNDYSNYQNFYEYTKYYNEQDTIIMFKIIDNVIEQYAVDDLDCLNNLSISSLASTMKYLKCYNDFDHTKEYPIEIDNSQQFTLTKTYWDFKVKSYKFQDEQKHRDTSNNVSNDDFDYYKALMSNATCWSCHRKFTWNNKPTLDRINNSIGHTKENCRLACLYCNKFCSDKDAQLRSFFIQLKRYATYNNLPFSVDNEDIIKLIQKDINGGLSNVHHRINKSGENTITKLKYHEESNSVEIIDTKNIISHFIGIDFNSLYPSVFSGQSHDEIKYTNGKMYMPGRVTSYMEVKNELQLKRALSIIHSKDRFNENGELFIADVKGYIPKERLNECINFLPIIRNIDVLTNEGAIGKYMYDYMIKNNYDIEKVQRKLTQTYCTNPIQRWDEAFNYHKSDEYMTFSSYYLWFLIDQFGFIVEDVKSIITFSKHLAFNKFVKTCMNRRQDAMIEGNKLANLHNKNMMNSSYGYDSMRTDTYNKTKIVDKKGAYKCHRSPYHIDTIELGRDKYLTVEQTKSYEIKTPLQCAAFTLDNAKYWYLNFIYNFMNKCLDMNKIHFVEGDTDSQYWAVAGDLYDSDKQGFKYVINDEQFYNENVFKWLPYDFFCTDEKYRPQFNTDKERMSHEKKLLGCAIEKQGLNIVALGPKCYTTWGTTENNEKQISLKVKGVNKNTNKHLNYKSYCEVIAEEKTINGTNYLLQFKQIDNSTFSISNEVKVKTKLNNFIDQLNELQEKEDKTVFDEARIVSLEYEIEQLREIIQTQNWNKYIDTNIYKYCRITLNKIALSGVHIKMKVHDDNCQTCTPLYLRDYDPELEHYLIDEEYVECDLHSCTDGLKLDYTFDSNNYCRVKSYRTENGAKEYVDYVDSIPRCLQFPTRNYEKCSKYALNDSDSKHDITGCALNLAYANVIVVDFDFRNDLTVDEKIELREQIIKRYNLKSGLVQTTSYGLHVYFKADKIPSWYNKKGRFVKCFSADKYDIDLFISNVNFGQNFVMYPGSKAKNHSGVIRCYQKLSEWRFDDLENYSDFDKRFFTIENRFLVDKPIEKPKIINQKYKIESINKEELNEVLEQLKDKLIHANRGVTCYKLLICFSSFDENTYRYCVDYLRNNCILTNKALNCLDEQENNYDEIRDKYRLNNGLARLKTYLKQL